MRLSSLFPQTFWGRMVLVCLGSLILFKLIVSPTANHWTHVILNRNFVFNEVRLLTAHAGIMASRVKPGRIVDTQGLQIGDERFNIQLSGTNPHVLNGNSEMAHNLKERLEKSFREEGILFSDLTVNFQIISGNLFKSDRTFQESGSHARSEDFPLISIFLMPADFQVEVAYCRPDGVWIRFSHTLNVISQDIFWIQIACAVLELVFVAACLVLFLFWLLRPLRDLILAAETFGKNREVAPLRTDVGPSEVREAAAAFNHMRQSICHTLDERERIITAMSHDLRTPLTRIRLRLEQVDQVPLREKLCRDVDTLCDTLNGTIELLRSMRKPEEGVPPLKVMPFLKTLVENHQDVGQDVTLFGGTEASVASDIRRFGSCVENLVENALRYGGATSIHVRDDGTWVYIDVRDNGPGIPEDSIEQVFEPFVRLERSRNPKTGGHGLGLSIAKYTACQSGGDLILSNLPGGGLSARLIFPACHDEQPACH